LAHLASSVALAYGAKLDKGLQLAHKIASVAGYLAIEWDILAIQEAHLPLYLDPLLLDCNHFLLLLALQCFTASVAFALKYWWVINLR
jgi:hypothetical protein